MSLRVFSLGSSAVIGLILATLAACQSSDTTGSNVPKQTSYLAEPWLGQGWKRPPVAVGAGVTELPCKPTDAVGTIVSFAAAFNSGNIGNAVAHFAKAPAFRWYTINNRAGDQVTAFSPSELKQLLLKRYRAGEKLQLLAGSVGPSTTRGAVAVSIALSRRAADIPDGFGGAAGLAHGKAEVICFPASIYVWSVGMEPSVSQAKVIPSSISWPCDRPKGWTPADGALACRSP